MATADRFRKAADRGRRAADALGQRPFTVSIIVAQYDRPWCDAAIEITAQRQTTVLSPSPKVEPQGSAPSSFGDDLWSGADASIESLTVRIGPITPQFPGGGYTDAQLVPTAVDTTQRVYVLIEGPGFATGGVKFESVRAEFTTPQHYYLIASRTAQ